MSSEEKREETAVWQTPLLVLAGTFMLLGVCFLREAPERAIGTDRRAGKWGLIYQGLRSGKWTDGPDLPTEMSPGTRESLVHNGR